MPVLRNTQARIETFASFLKNFVFEFSARCTRSTEKGRLTGCTELGNGRAATYSNTEKDTGWININRQRLNQWTYMVHQGFQTLDRHFLQRTVTLQRNQIKNHQE